MIVGGISYHQNLGESEKLSQGTFISSDVKMIVETDNENLRQAEMFK